MSKQKAAKLEDFFTSLGGGLVSWAKGGTSGVVLDNRNLQKEVQLSKVERKLS
jgi:hypothetical protein